MLSLGNLDGLSATVMESKTTKMDNTEDGKTSTTEDSKAGPEKKNEENELATYVNEDGKAGPKEEAKPGVIATKVG